MDTAKVAYQRELQERAQRGDAAALEALYRSMLPLIKSRVRRVLAQHRQAFAGWYGADDLIQDAYVVFHRFVMSSNPDVPLYRLLAGAFEHSLRRHLVRHGPLADRAGVGGDQSYGLDDGPPGDGWTGAASQSTAHETACASELLAALPAPSDRQMIVLSMAGYTAAEAARQMGLSLASLRYQRRRLRTHLARCGWIDLAYGPDVDRQN